MRRTANGLLTVATLLWAASGSVAAWDPSFGQRVAAQEATATSVDANLSPPGPVQGLSMPTFTAIVWTSGGNGETWDLIKGSLAGLRQGGGDFAGSVLSCLNDDTSVPNSSDPVVPIRGAGFYYLVRASQGAETGTYDDGFATLHASRDPGIAAAPLACP